MLWGFKSPPGQIFFWRNMLLQRAQWPHTPADIIKALDGVWGVVGAVGDNGNLYRLERSLKAPTSYTFIEYQGQDETQILNKETFSQEHRVELIRRFASALGFNHDFPVE